MIHSSTGHPKKGHEDSRRIAAGARAGIKEAHADLKHARDPKGVHKSTKASHKKMSY